MRSGWFSAHGQALERGDELRRQIARRALIGPGRIGEPVGNDPGAARKRRQNRPLEMVGARGGEQQRLPGGAEVGGESGKDRLAQGLGARRPSRLPGSNDRNPKRCEALLEPPGLHRFPGALPALERDETTFCLRGHRRAGLGAASASSIHELHCTKSHRQSFLQTPPQRPPPRALLSMVLRELATSGKS